MVLREPLRAHFLPSHTLNEPVGPGEQTRCGKLVVDLPPGAMRQDWREVWSSPWTCQDCVHGLQYDEEATRA